MTDRFNGDVKIENTAGIKINPATEEKQDEIIAKMPELESNGAAPVNIQDQTSPPFDLYFIQATGTSTTVGTAPSIDDTTLTLASATGFVDGTYFGVFNAANNRYFFASQVGAASGNDITIDTPIDFEFEVGDNVLAFSRDLSVDGSVTPQVFEIQGPGGDA